MVSLESKYEKPLNCDQSNQLNFILKFDYPSVIYFMNFIHA